MLKKEKNFIQHYLSVILLVLCFSISTHNNVSALEYDIVTTQNAPGFFAITLLPETSPNNKCSELLIVKNFSDQDSVEYQSLIEQALSRQTTTSCPNKASVINSTYLSKVSPQSFQKIIVLGNTNLPYPTFNLKKQNKKSFSAFLAKYAILPEIFITNIQIENDSNLSDIVFENHNIDTQKPFVISGKFKNKKKSIIKIRGKKPKNNLPSQINIALDLPNKELANHPLSKDLPALWAQIHQTNNPSQKTTKEPQSNELLIMLLTIGLGFIIFFVVKKIHTKSKNSSNTTEFIKSSPKTIQASKAVHIKNLPFEIEKSTKKID